MTTLGARLAGVSAGVVEIVLPYRADLVQQHGFLHGGVITTIVDSACGYAAYSLMAAGAHVLTIEFKVNFLAPAAGEEFRAHGRVVRAGRTIYVCNGDVYARTGGSDKQVATMLATMMTLEDEPTQSDQAEVVDPPLPGHHRRAPE